jgi:hypothetical protein
LAESVLVKLPPPSVDMKPSPRYWEKSQPATRLPCAELPPPTNAARASEISEMTILVFMPRL